MIDYTTICKEKSSLSLWLMSGELKAGQGDWHDGRSGWRTKVTLTGSPTDFSQWKRGERS